MLVGTLRDFTGRPVRLLLRDGTEHRGVLRTELLTEQSISVFIGVETGEGSTIYIDQIAEIQPQN